MGQSVYPVATVSSGDPASQTVPAVAAGTYTLATTLAAGTYEITTDTVQSSFTLKLKSADGYEYSGTIRGGKGYIVAASPVTQMVVPASLTYPLNINVRLGASNLIAAPTGVSIAFNGTGNNSTVTWTPPAGATDIVAYWRDGTNTSMATTTSPKTNVALNGTVHLAVGYVMLVAKDANGNIGFGTEAVTSTTANIPISSPSGGVTTAFTSGGTNYLAITFTGSGTLNVNAISNIEYLVVAGGGAGSTGGAGAGGVLTGTKTSVPVSSMAVTVGAGGAGRSGTRDAANIYGGTPGNSSSVAFATPVSTTGGGGGGMVTQVNSTYCSQQAGGNGGSGGGGGSNYNSGGSSAGGTGVAGQGNAGGAGASDRGPQWGIGGGGGGAGAAGGNCNTGTGAGGTGGVGVSSSINNTATFYGGGGGGCRAGSGTPGAGGSGGGTTATTGNVGTSAAANTGGGAGGAGGIPTPGYGLNGSGGSGIVIVRVAL
jgi:hypothetical protein